MKLRADCKTSPVAIIANPRTPIHIAVNPGPTRASTELEIPLIALNAIAAPAANKPKPGNPRTSNGFFCDKESNAHTKTVNP